MKDNKLEKIEFAKRLLNTNGLIFEEFPNGHLRIEGIDFWATTGKWINVRIGTNGNGINSFVSELKKVGLMEESTKGKSYYSENVEPNEIKITIKDSRGNEFSKSWKGTANRIDAIRWTIESDGVRHYLEVDKIVEITITEGVREW